MAKKAKQNPPDTAKTAGTRERRGWWETFVHELPYYLVLGVMIFAFRSSLAENYVIPSGSMEPTLKEGDYLFALKCAYDLHVPFTGIKVAHFGEIERGDIVIFPSVENDGNKLIKRVVGIPGDRIELRNDRVYLNGEILKRTNAAPDPGLYDLPDARYKDLYVEQLDDVTHFVFNIKGKRTGDNFGIVDHSAFGVNLPAGHPADGPITVPEGKIFVMGDNRDESRDSRYFGFVPIESVLGRAGIIYMSLDKRGIDADGSTRPKWFWRLRHERLGRIVR